MKKSIGLAVVAAISFLLYGCLKDKGKDFANCEESAYKQIGLQVEATASIDYLEKKGELVRLCMVKNGYSYRWEHFSAMYRDQLESISKRRGLWTASRVDPQNAAAFKQADNELERWRASNQYASACWD